jgi:hypothetical protein
VWEKEVAELQREGGEELRGEGREKDSHGRLRLDGRRRWPLQRGGPTLALWALAKISLWRRSRFWLEDGEGQRHRWRTGGFFRSLVRWGRKNEKKTH